MKNNPFALKNKVKKSAFSQAELSQTAKYVNRSTHFSSISGDMLNFNILFFEVVIMKIQ